MKKQYMAPEIEAISYSATTNIASCWDLAGWVIGGSVEECRTNLYSSADCLDAKLAS